METLATIVPDVDHLLRLEPEELGPILLRLARKHAERGVMFHTNNLEMITTGTGMAATAVSCYPAHRASEVEAVVSEGWAWLRANVLIVPAPGTNGNQGWMVFSRRGAKLAAASDADFARFRAAGAFPKSLRPLTRRTAH